MTASALLSCLAALYTFGEPPKVTISKETTYITGPLRADGMVDYVAHFNAALKDLKPEDNAAVLLARAAGPKAVSPKIAQEFYRLLKCDLPQEGGAFLVDLDGFLDRKGAAAGGLKEAGEKCRRRPWKRAEQPLLDELLAANEAPLKLIVEASRKPRLVAPVVAEKSPPMLFNCELPLVQIYRQGERLLLLRAMRSAGEGRFDAAYEDLDAVHRLAGLVGSAARPLIEGIVAVALRNAALRAEQSLAFAPGRPAEELRRRAGAAAGLPPPADLFRSFDEWERLSLLNATADTMVYGVDEMLGEMIGGKEGATGTFDAVAVDEALRTVNGWYDRFAKAIRKKAGEKGPTVNALEDELSAKARKRRERESSFFLFRPAPPAHPRGAQGAAGEAVGETMLGLLLPAFGMIQRPMLRATATQRQTALAYALAARKAERGGYPAKLDAKDLGVSPETLLDPFTNKPFDYVLQDGKRRVVGFDPGPKSKPGLRSPDKPDEHILELP